MRASGHRILGLSTSLPSQAEGGEERRRKRRQVDSRAMRIKGRRGNGCLLRVRLLRRRSTCVGEMCGRGRVQWRAVAGDHVCRRVQIHTCVITRRMAFS